MSRYRATYLLLCCWAFSTALCARVQLQVEGLSGDLQKNVNARLTAINLQEETVTDSHLRSLIEKEITKGIRALGYYQPMITFTDRPASGSEPALLVAHVTVGEPVKIAGVNITLQGSARKDNSFKWLIIREKPKVGDILNHGKYDDLKKNLNDTALRKGYFDADFVKSQLGVALGLHQAYWDIDFNSGNRYRFGKVTFQGSQIRDEYLQNLLPFQYGDYYSANKLAELNRRLSAVGWFKSAVVSPDFDNSRATKILPLNALVIPQARNAIELGAGYSTDIGPRGKIQWKKPWLNNRGQSLESSLNLSAPEQNFDASYKIPLLKNPLEQYYLMQAGYQRQNLNDTDSRGYTFNVARYWNLSSGWQRSINLRWSLEHFIQGSEDNSAMLIYPGFAINRTRQRGGLMPFWGDTQNYSIDISRTMWSSDIDFTVLQLQNVWIRSLAKVNRFVVRANAGWIATNDFNRVPPSLRFFAGGDRSIRGYKYKSISPLDDEGKLSGASKMVTGSLEYQYNLTGKWWVALFVDSGEAVNDIRKSNIKTGAGTGIRWQSPVGPIKFDIAMPVGDREEHGIQFYIGLGPEL